MYDGGFGGGGFDWNGNGHRDHVDGYMDYKICNDNSSGNNSRRSAGNDYDGIGWFIICGIAMFLVIAYVI